MIDAFVKAIRQLGDPAIRRVLWLGIGVSLAVLAALWTGVGYLLTQTTVFQTGWLDAAVDALGGIATLAISWFLFPVVISAFVGLFLEQIAEAVEQRHYPALPPARDIPFAEALAGSVRFLGLTLALNLLVLLFLIVPPVFPFVFYGVNGYLLSREYFEVVAARRMPAAAVREMRKKHMRRLFLSGLVVAFLLTVPIVNLLAPIVGTAAMVHIFHRLRGAAPAP
ncbi:MAG: EI24 domain-containing protein [Rhodospirillales bacterium]|nr:EI24 domain-containing protein [Rhodospirillales bacterium]